MVAPALMVVFLLSPKRHLVDGRAGSGGKSRRAGRQPAKRGNVSMPFWDRARDRR